MRKYIKPELNEVIIDSEISLLMCSQPVNGDNNMNNGNHSGWGNNDNNPHYDNDYRRPELPDNNPFSNTPF